MEINPNLRCNSCLGSLSAVNGFLMTSCKHLICGKCDNRESGSRGALPAAAGLPVCQCDARADSPPCSAGCCSVAAVVGPGVCAVCKQPCQSMELNEVTLDDEYTRSIGVTGAPHRLLARATAPPPWLSANML